MPIELSAAAALAPGGPLAAHIPGFAARAPQQQMADAVADALAGGGTLIVEAGTGTGKTYAYLVPALLCGSKVIVSTGTRNLQDQLFHRDLPVVREALGAPVRAALLKGRSNYLCPHRLELAAAGPSRADDAELQTIRAWAGRTVSGDIAELGEVPEEAPVWAVVTSTAENCLGQECPQYGECHVVKARRAAQEADLVVVNHHLLLADMALKEGGFGEVLPGANAFILDEAHQLPEVAGGFFGISVSARQIQELARDAAAEHLREAGDMPAIPAAAQAVARAATELRTAFGSEQRRAPWREVCALPAVGPALVALRAAQDALAAALAPAAERGKGLESCWRRACELADRLELVTGTAAEDRIQWLETHARSYTLHSTPLDVGETFRTRMSRERCAWVLTSATLAVGESFAHFAQRMGIADAATLRLESPFAYERNALCYVPADLPDPSHPAHTTAVVETALEVLRASQGRAFLLFTSHRALREAAELLGGRTEYPLLVQGRAGRGELLERFRTLGNAVLLGTGSFWEGVDVRGPALSCVIIDKLPFASPGDPVLQARIEALKARGGNPFVEHQIPAAVIALKQGVGRLIRDAEDRGVLTICDPRLYSRPYGRLFLDSLPAMRRTRELADVCRFFGEAERACAGGAVD
jgi:ATP-dependent DNA helicase DinG